MGKLSGKVSLVTGACSGIGGAIADLYASEGAAVGILDLDGVKAAAVAEELTGAQGVPAAGVEADVADEAQVKAAIETLTGALGEIDILVNNAGIDTTSTVEAMSTETFDRMVAVHLRGTFLCTREVLPAMRESGGSKTIPSRCAGKVSSRASS